MNISKELLSEVLDYKIETICQDPQFESYVIVNREKTYNIYELVHKKLKHWAKIKNIFDVIDWSEDIEQIFKKAEELENEHIKRIVK